MQDLLSSQEKRAQISSGVPHCLPRALIPHALYLCVQDVSAPEDIMYNSSMKLAHVLKRSQWLSFVGGLISMLAGDQDN